MGYYIRVLGTQDPDISVDELNELVQKAGLSAKINWDSEESPTKWTVLDVDNAEGQTIMQIERNPVVEGELGYDELAEFRERILEERPVSAVHWLLIYFDRVRVIYAFQLLNAAFEGENYNIVSALQSSIWRRTGGILQADGEGFSNEDGYHILWQFAEKVSGDWSCAVLNESGTWDRFRMQLGDLEQRKAFWAGKVPSTAAKLK